MGRKSSIDERLSEDDKANLNDLIRTGKLTIDGLLEWLGEKGYEISRSSLHRYAQKYDEVAARLRQSREMTDALVAEIGDSANQGKHGRLLVEMTRSLVFDLLMKIQGADDDPASPAGGLDTKDVMQLGKGLAELGRALRLDQDFETKIRDQLEKEITKKAVEAVDAVAQDNERGLSKDTVAEIKAKILGISKGKPA